MWNCHQHWYGRRKQKPFFLINNRQWGVRGSGWREQYGHQAARAKHTPVFTVLQSLVSFMDDAMDDLKKRKPLKLYLLNLVKFD
jgi:hypothetical protein